MALGFKEPFITSLVDQVVLVLMLGFIQKVASKFHMEIILSTFFSEDSQAINPLGVVKTLQAYIDAMSGIRPIDNLYVIPFGVNKEAKASSRTKVA